MKYSFVVYSDFSIYLCSCNDKGRKQSSGVALPCADVKSSFRKSSFFEILGMKWRDGF